MFVLLQASWWFQIFSGFFLFYFFYFMQIKQTNNSEYHQGTKAGLQNTPLSNGKIPLYICLAHLKMFYSFILEMIVHMQQLINIFSLLTNVK